MGVNSTVETMLVGQVDEDPDPELVISYAGGHMEIRDGPTREVEVDTNGTMDNVTSITVGDVDSDGHPELVLARGLPADVVIAQVRQGGLQEEWRWFAGNGDWPLVEGLASTAEGPVLPLLGIHPLCALSFTEASRLGDIAIDSVSVDRESPTEGDVVTLSVEMGMEGGFPAEVPVELYVDLQEDSEAGPIASRKVHLEPGGNVTVELPWTARLGDHSLHAVVNGRTYHLVAEVDYGNNALHVNVAVLRPYATVAWQLGWGEGAGLYGCTAAADADGDGEDELVMVDGSGHLVVQDLPEGAGEGFARPAWRSPRLGETPCALDVGDADGDGDPEAVVATIDGWVHMVDLGERRVTASAQVSPYGLFDVALINDPLFGGSQVAVLDTVAMLHFLHADDLSEEDIRPSCFGGTRLVAADMDGDKVDDLVVVGYYGFMAVHPAGGLGSRVLMETELVSATGVAVGDLAGDSRPELVVTDGLNVSLVEVSTEGNWTNRVIWQDQVPGPVTGLAVEDWDWDGDPELLVAGPRLRVYEMSTEDVLSLSAETDPGDDANGLALGHFPGRNGLRAALPLRDGRLFMADGLANDTEVLWSGLGLRTISMAVGDPDADGIPQVIAGTATGGVLVVDGLSVERSDYPVEGRAWAMAVMDWDGDGEEELAVQEEDGDLVLLGREGQVELTVATALAGRVEAMAPLPADGGKGPYLAYAEDDWKVHVVDLTSGIARSKDLPASVPVGMGTVTDDEGTRLLLLRRTGGFATMDPEDLAIVEQYPVHANTTAVAGYPGEPLVVAADSTGALQTIYLWSGETVAETQLGSPATLLTVRDLDNDDAVEVVAVTEDGAVHLLREDDLSPITDPLYPTGSMPTAMVAEDVDRDGAVEVVLGGWSEMVALRVGEGRPLPDLVAGLSGLPEEAVRPGEDLELVVEVRNRGLVPSGPFVTVVTLDENVVLNVTTSLAAMDDTSMGLSMQLVGWGQVLQLKVQVDGGDAVEEFDETNNALAATLRTIEGAEYRPDMRVDLLTVTPSRIPQGTNATVEARVSNVGTASFSGDVLVFVVDDGDGRRQVSSRDVSVLPGLSVDLDQVLEDLGPGDVAVLVQVVEDGGQVMASLETRVEVVPRADLGLLGLAVNTTATPRVRAGLPLVLDVHAVNYGGAEGSGILVLETVTGGERSVLATARMDLDAGEETVARLSFVPSGPGALVLEARVVPDGDDISDGNDVVKVTVMVLPHPSSYARLDQVLAELTDVGLHLTVVMRTGELPGAGAIEVRAYALDPADALTIAADPVGGLEAGSVDIYNATEDSLEPDSPVLFDTILSPFEPGDNGTVVLVVTYYMEDGERTAVGHRMVLVTGEDAGSGGSGDDGGIFWMMLVAAIVLVAVAVIWFLQARRSPREG
jgi:hypothetical protein